MIAKGGSALRNSGKYFMALTFFCFLTGCQTIRLPSGPDVSKLGFMPNAPLASVQVSDTRDKDKIGTIGAAQIIVKKADTVGMIQNYVLDFLYRQGINVVAAPQLNFSQTENIRSAAQMTNAQGVVKFELNALRVNSIDLLLDPPTYEVDALFVLYSKDGTCLFQEYIHGRKQSQALTEAGKGKAVGEAVNNALWTLEASQGFKKAVSSLKS